MAKLSYNNEIYEIPVSLSLTSSQLRESLFSKFNLNNSHILTYKNSRITKNDELPLYILFKDDKNPFLFINDSNTILPSIKQNSSITIKTSIPQQKLLNILNSFFISKNYPFDANIKSPTKDVYIIKFNKPVLAHDFLNYYNKKTFKKIDNKKKYFIAKTDNIKKVNSRYLSKKLMGNNNSLPYIREKTKNKTPSKSDIVIRNDKYIALYKVVKELSKSDLISEKSISSGINKYHYSSMGVLNQSKNMNIKRYNKEYINNDKYNDEPYEGIYNFPFMSQEEKYYREKFLDKKNWINKEGFIVSVGKYKMKENNFIPNYVTATPSEPPLNHRYRDIDKNKWINKKGFII
jgi:hypothetical protein